MDEQDEAQEAQLEERSACCAACSTFLHVPQ